MRIVSGKFKGRRFHPPKHLPVRPTTDFAKEGLFNLLRTRVDLEQKKVLDLFCGTGNMSLEFTSRGAHSVVAVDQNRSCLEFIKKVCKELEISEIKTIKADGLSFLKKESTTFDLIFADPPYAFQHSLQIAELIFEKKLLKPTAYFILEHGKDQSFDDHPRFSFSRKFGNVNFTFFQEASR